MDRIQKALDLSRAERASRAGAVGAARAERVQQVGAEPASNASTAGAAPANSSSAVPERIVYTRSRVFTPPPGILERNRITNPAAADAASVAFRMLRTQVLQRMDANGWRSLAIFSPTAADGKTTTAINLALSLASDRRHTVLLVDFDFKRPSLAAKLGLAADLGAEDALLGRAALEDCLYHPEGFERLLVLPACATLVDSSEILAGPRSRAIVSELRSRYPERVIVYDLPPVMAADDALAFAPLVECGLVVAAEGRTRRNDLARTVELLHKTPLVGTVLNRASQAPPGY